MNLIIIYGIIKKQRNAREKGTIISLTTPTRYRANVFEDIAAG